MRQVGGKRSAPQQARAQRTRAELLRAAAEVFAEQGFFATTLTAITDRAGVTLGAVYFHFRNKEELAREIVQQQPERVRPVLEELRSDGLQFAVDVTLGWAHLVVDDVFLLAGARLVMDQEFFMNGEQNSHQQWTEVLLESLFEARRRREMRTAVDAEALARLIVNACTGAQMHAHLETERRDLPQRVRDMWLCLLPAVATPAALSKIEMDESRYTSR
ncbi:ScbR family autoregulator-binding transcription factor [Streptomyces beigongshangae]|uniref:ScbR family autoregulator-binding transcription factor n=1 Tax=Streptomyces beigongshangae TaxID=2841597 RepID=UPI001C84EB99|nr:ScbR family autoregulator-binding transcription factor [Streptomyces sp. REN17]